MERYAIIVAGGSGSRMGSEIPKQFLELAGRPILMHTIAVFNDCPEPIKIILVLPEASFSIWKALCIRHDFQIPVELVKGGASRFLSVKNGLSVIKNPDSLVAIHDGVRPLITQVIIENSFNLAAKSGSAIASMPLKESIRMEQANSSVALDRSKMRLIQTPQTFRTGLIKAAFEAYEDSAEFTDDASVADKYGHPVFLFDGSYRNIKITTPEDLLFAEAVLDKI